MALSTNRTQVSSLTENSILFEACEHGDLEKLKTALNSLSSSDISLIRDELKATLVHYAARYGHVHILEYLIEKKHLDISQLRTEHGATCAHDAAVCDQVQALNYIFHYNNKQDSSQKLRWTVRDEQGNSPLHLAAAYGSINTLHYLLEDELADAHIRSYNGFQAIHYAASSGHGECVKLLLSIAPDTVNEQTSTLLTPLYLACQFGSLEIVKILSSHGANFKLRDENGLNCLHCACQSSHLNVVQWLVETQNANVDDVDYMNNTSLHYAASSGSEPILTYLLGKNARVTTSSDGNTPLHVAAENGQQGACAILIERGRCSVTLRNSSQSTPADLANRYGFPALANELRLRANPPLISQNSSIISNKIQLGNATIVRLVVKKRNVERFDASNQVNENELMTDSNSSKKLTNQRFDLSELRARVEEHEAVRRDPSNHGDNVLMHSMDSLNQQNRSRQRSKLPRQTYAPWLKMGNITSEAFQEEIVKVGSNLRKVRRDNLLKTDETTSNAYEPRTRQSQSVGPPLMTSGRNGEISSSNSAQEYTNNTKWKRAGFETRPVAIPSSKSHQFITASSQSGSQLDMPEWRRALVDRRRTGVNGSTTQS